MGIIEKQSVQDIANAIRNRNGLTTLYKPREMDEAIRNLYSTTKVNSMLDYILPCYEKEATSYTIKYADSDRPGSITKLEGNTTQNGTPTPTNPIPIYTVSGDNEVVVSNEQHVTGNSYRVDLGGKNLLNNTATTQTINGITFTVNEDKSITLNGTSTQGFVVELVNNLILDSGAYNLSLRGKIQGCGIYAYVGSNNLKAYVSSNNTAENWQSTFTLNEQTTFTQVRIDIRNASTFNNVTIYPQLEKGSTATEYSPYVSNPIELCKIGNYVDTIFKAEEGNEKYDSLDSTTKESLTLGNWYIEKNIGKVVLNGSEEWTYYTATSKPVFYLLCESYGINYKQQSGLICYSNYYLGKGQVNSFDNVYNLGNNVIAFRTSFTRLVIRNDSITSVVDFKTWLSTHNTTVYYALATPTYEIITNENLIQQLNNIQDMQLIENLCYVDWVGVEKPKMKLFCYLDKDKIIEEITG